MVVKGMPALRNPASGARSSEPPETSGPALAAERFPASMFSDCMQHPMRSTGRPVGLQKSRVDARPPALPENPASKQLFQAGAIASHQFTSSTAGSGASGVKQRRRVVHAAGIRSDQHQRSAADAGQRGERLERVQRVDQDVSRSTQSKPSAASEVCRQMSYTRDAPLHLDPSALARSDTDPQQPPVSLLPP